VLLLNVSVSGVVSQEPTPTDKLDRLIVYGDDFAFSVKQPKHWNADTGDLAREYDVNIVFTPVHNEEKTNIRVRVNSKIDEDTAKDLNYDMKQYKKNFPNCKFAELSLKHPKYKTFAKLVYEPSTFFEYVAYINPGPNSKFAYSVALSRMSRPATAEEFEAFETVLKSLQWLSAGIQKP